MTDDNAIIRFGTDGWRALIARDYTFENIRKVAEAISTYLHDHQLNSQSIIIGYDSRFGSYAFACEVAEVMSSRGIEALISDSIVPTPAVSYNIIQKQAGAGVVITASHNSWEWNGLKFKPSFGGSAPPEVIAEIELLIENPKALNPLMGKKQKSIPAKLVDLRSSYLSNLSQAVNLQLIRESGLSVLVDSMHGAGAGYLRSLLEGGKTQITEIREEQNPIFPNMKQPEPIESNLHPAVELLKKGGYEVAIANDGDADRLGILDENGEYIDTLTIFSLLCLHQLVNKSLTGTIVRAITQSNMINKLAEKYGSTVITTPVGFKFLGPAMMATDAIAAGEESGGYAFRGNIPERDGLLSGLLFLELMAQTGMKVSELVQHLHSEVGDHYYNRLDIDYFNPSAKINLVEVQESSPSSLAGLKIQRKELTDGLLFSLENGYWGLIRPSGTEPLVRIYAEADSPSRVAGILHEMRSLISL